MASVLDLDLDAAQISEASARTLQGVGGSNIALVSTSRPGHVAEARRALASSVEPSRTREARARGLPANVRNSAEELRVLG